MVFGRDGNGKLFSRFDGKGPDVPVDADVKRIANK
jgi:hypothetical protein|tara:strand:+ start:393 stop:497 length:105 start_codon:yes stop_codon:yes gene_type:complete